MLALVVVEGVAIVLLGLLVAGLLRSHAEILQSLHELGAGVYPDADTGRRGAPTPVRIGAHRPADAAVFDLAGTTLADDVAALAIAGSPQRTLLAFLSSGCATCARFWEAFGDPGLTVPGGARLVIVTKDATEESEARLRELSPADETLVLSSAAWQDYRVPAAPYFVYVDGTAGRVVGEGSAGTWPQVAALMQQAIDDAGLPSARVDRRSGRPVVGDADREARAERELLAAGITPGHPSLHAAPDAAGRDD